MPQFWIATFFVLLAIAQLYQSIKDVELPFPVYLILGAALAIAANSQPNFFGGQDQQAKILDLQSQELSSNPLLKANFITTDGETKSNSLSQNS